MTICTPGWVDKVKIQTLLSISNVGVLPFYQSKYTHEYELPNKLFEYLSSGLVILNSVKGFLSDLLESNDCGITYSESDVSDCMNKILYIYNLNDLFKEKSNNSLRLFQDKYSHDVVFDNSEQYILDLINQ